jgi:uncharacterized protein YbjT (DUF2867 family)
VLLRAILYNNSRIAKAAEKIVPSTSTPKWDIGRFWETFNYFALSPLFRDWQRRLTLAKTPSLESSMGLILVAGATGGVGKRLVRQLRQRGYQVLALVRDEARAKALLPEGVELFAGDLTIPQTLTPELFAQVEAIICCTGTKVQPVEGDTPSREKYYQGLKFYLPEVGDIPEQVEYEGMKNLVAAAKKYLKSEEKMLFDFTQPHPALKEIWGAVDDVVMGGVSQSSIRLVNGRGLFSGQVSTANRGGFASVRTRNFSPALDLSAYQGILLQLQGDGKRYKFITRCEGNWDGVGYCYSFDTIANFSQSLEIPFHQLIPVFRAKTVPEVGPIDTQSIYSLQLMMSKFEYNGELNPTFSEGLFGLEIEAIKAYGKKITTPQFILISSAGVTRPGRPGLNLEAEPPAVRLNEQLGGILTWKLRGEQVVRESGLTYTIIRPCALTEKPAEPALLFAQGDNIRGQVSREAIAQLCLETLTSTALVNKTFEVAADTDKTSPGDLSREFKRLQPD